MDQIAKPRKSVANMMDENKLNHPLHQTFFGNLKILGFEKYLKANSKYNDVLFSPRIFYQINQKAFELVTHFLFTHLKKKKDLYKGCFPCCDAKQKSDFRKKTNDFIKDLERNGLISGYVQGVIHNPGGDKFVHLYLLISEIVLRAFLKQKFNFNENVNKLSSLEKINETETLVQTYEEKDLAFDNQKKNFQNKIEQITIYLGELENCLDQRKKHFEKLIENNNLKNIYNENDETDVNSSDTNINEKLNDNINEIKVHWNDLNTKIKQISIKIADYFMLLQTLSNKDKIIDFSDISDQIKLTNNEKYFTSIINSFQECVQLLTLHGKDLATVKPKLNYVSTEIEKHIKDLKIMQTALNEELSKLNENNLNLKQLVLSHPKVNERRKWFADRIPRLPKLVFGPVKYDKLNLSEHIKSFSHDSIEIASENNLLPFESFRFTDMSTFESRFNAHFKTAGAVKRVSELLNDDIKEEDENDFSNVFDEQEISFISDKE